MQPKTPFWPGIIGFNTVFLITIILFILSPSNIATKAINCTATLCGMWILIGTSLWARYFFENPSKNFGYFRFLFGWYFSMYSRKAAQWVTRCKNKKFAFMHKIQRALISKKKFISKNHSWSEKQPTVPGYYWAVLQGQDTMELVLVLEYSRSSNRQLYPTIDGVEYSFECFHCWSDRLIPPDPKTARSKCFHH